ncbi:MAG: ribonuclease Y [Chloroflexi bacterium]|nr:ribonuclease Y [Chloroflexota bacterium]
MQKREQRMTTREEHLERKVEQFEKRERTQVLKEQLADQKTAEAEALRASQLRELERISNLTEESARAELIARIEGSAREEATQRIREIEQQTKEEAARRARWIVAQAIQRCASDTSIELTQTSVSIPSEEMKGRIIGKEGRNIRALEAATGVDLIIDDTPETVILSSSKTEVEQQMKDDGERAAYEAGVPGLNVELVKLLGRLKFRSSYGQNQLQHSLEVSFLAGAMAAEVGADIAVCRRAGLLHDIGKALDHEIEGPHALIGADFARKYAVPPRVVHAIQAHHFEVDPQTVEAFLVAAADAISASRPGARRETVDNYIKRLEALEGVASSFSGVDKAYALQAGREVRILVKPDQVNEDEAWSLSRDIVKRIEETMDFPGQIKVTVIRETRVVDYAR